MGYRFGYFKCGFSNKGHCFILSQLDQKNKTYLRNMHLLRQYKNKLHHFFSGKPVKKGYLFGSDARNDFLTKFGKTFCIY